MHARKGFKSGTPQPFLSHFFQSLDLVFQNPNPIAASTLNIRYSKCEIGVLC
jgi:hypothetical protein